MKIELNKTVEHTFTLTDEELLEVFETIGNTTGDRAQWFYDDLKEYIIDNEIEGYEP